MGSEDSGVSYGAGDFFGEIALIADQATTATITALTVCKLLVLRSCQIIT